MKAIISLKKENIKEGVDQMIQKGTIVNSEVSNSYDDLDSDYKTILMSFVTN